MKKLISVILIFLVSFSLCSCGKDVNSYSNYCTLEIECKSVFDNIEKLDKNKTEIIPEDGVIFPETKCGFNEGESVYDVIMRVCRENKIHLDASITPAFNTAYVKGINNLYEFDCGELSGWIYSVNGDIPNFGCSDYKLTDGDKIIFRYICEYSGDF